jgi:hypothetical protein
VETREFRGTPSASNRVFPQPARELEDWEGDSCFRTMAGHHCRKRGLPMRRDANAPSLDVWEGAFCHLALIVNCGPFSLPGGSATSILICVSQDLILSSELATSCSFSDNASPLFPARPKTALQGDPNVAGAPREAEPAFSGSAKISPFQNLGALLLARFATCMRVEIPCGYHVPDNIGGSISISA